MGPGDVRRTAIAMIPKTGEIRISPGTMHSKSKARFQIEAHQELCLRWRAWCWKGLSVSAGRPLGTSHGVPPCLTRKGVPAIYSGEEGRYGSLLKVCDLRVHRTDDLKCLRLPRVYALASPIGSTPFPTIRPVRGAIPLLDAVVSICARHEGHFLQTGNRRWSGVWFRTFS